ncbi:outer membrane beta-barrel family protein [Tenacibaculum haliotis]|uniref:outer membrane beta-barrel family protein n=1 Tax=Tenacibaculum haliotis TaxID=1888914 RepID=UPI0021AF7205|nr:outer membrane beta-barrel family protein [Tenacibaculum haliotis]MCT4698032.1 TonB-dependent receptor family protein [Tenacibaculum haliotis]
MKKILLLIFTVFSVSLFAQMPKSNLPKAGTVSGKVIDKTTKEPLPYVNIIIKDAANKILTGGITNDNGTFSIKNIPEGKNTIEIQFIGYKTISKQVTINNKNRKINLGTISLIEDSTTLDEVEIRAETSTVVQKVDRKVINVGKDLTSAGTTASELLNNVQSVSVDSQTGGISLRGNSNVRVLVDGKPTNMSAAQLLKQIPSSSIKSIELITNPSAKYNPEGMSGIINIILNKNANMGFNGSVDLGVTTDYFTRFNGSTNMNYKTGKVNFFGNYGYNTGNNLNYGQIERPENNNVQQFRGNNANTSHLAKIGADIYINDKNTLSFYTTQNWFDAHSLSVPKIYENNVLTSHAPNDQKVDGSSSAYNVNYKIDFAKEGHNLEFESTYSYSDSPEKSISKDLVNSSTKLLNYFNTIKNEGENTLINLDYTNPISEKGKLEVGLEYRVNNTKNINTTDQEENTYLTDVNGVIITDVNGNPQITGTERIGNSSFNYDRKIYSGYINYGHNFGKVTMQLGARLEQYKIDGNFNLENEPSATVTDDIFSVYPSAFFTYNPSEKNQFQLSYSRRVDRPGIGQVNPIRQWSTPLITSIGNENLAPQFTNSLEINYTRKIKGGSLSFGTFYREINDAISRVTYKDPTDPNEVRQILSFANFDDTSSYGLEFSANYKVNNWWRLNSSMDFYSQKQFGTADLNNPNSARIEVQNETFNARISNNFKATKNLRFQLFAMYRGPGEDIQWKTKEMWMINTGASLTVLKGKGTINFRVNDIFNGMKFGFDSTRPYKQSGQFNWESQTTYLGFNYRFGGGKNKAKARRQRDNNEKQGGGMF